MIAHVTPSEGINVFIDVVIVECYRTLLVQLLCIGSTSVATFYQELSCICSMSWFAMSRTEGSCASLVGECWRLETIELYSQRLLELKPTEFTDLPSARTLLFTNEMTLHTPLEHFQDIAHAIAAREGAPRSATPVLV